MFEERKKRKKKKDSKGNVRYILVYFRDVLPSIAFQSMEIVISLEKVVFVCFIKIFVHLKKENCVKAWFTKFFRYSFSFGCNRMVKSGKILFKISLIFIFPRSKTINYSRYSNHINMTEPRFPIICHDTAHRKEEKKRQEGGVFFFFFSYSLFFTTLKG